MGRRGPVRPAYGSGEENQTSELRESGVAGPADLRRRSQGASCLLPRSRGRGSGWGTGNGAARDGPTGVRLRARGIGRLNCESVVAGRLIWGRSAAKRRVAGAGVREGVKRPGNQLGVDRPPRGVAGNPSPGPNPPPPFSVGGSHDNAEALAARGRTGVQRPQGGWRALAGGGRSGGKAAARRRRRRPVGTSLGPSRSPFPRPEPPPLSRGRRSRGRGHLATGSRQGKDLSAASQEISAALTHPPKRWRGRGRTRSENPLN